MSRRQQVNLKTSFKTKYHNAAFPCQSEIKDSVLLFGVEEMCYLAFDKNQIIIVDSRLTWRLSWIQVHRAYMIQNQYDFYECSERFCFKSKALQWRHYQVFGPAFLANKLGTTISFSNSYSVAQNRVAFLWLPIHISCITFTKHDVDPMYIYVHGGHPWTYT